jgi:hypothetical protein
MGLGSAMPAVCSAIGSNKFTELASAQLLERAGPSNGANVYFRFGLHAHTKRLAALHLIAAHAEWPVPVTCAHHRGLPKVDWQLTFAMAAYNLIRLPKLLAQGAGP